MMGHQGGVQDKLFYSFNLDDQVPQSHLLRGIDRVFDLSDLRQHLAPFYSHTGRPSIDPELMMRMLVVDLPVRYQPVSGPNIFARGHRHSPGHETCNAMVRTGRRNADYETGRRNDAIIGTEHGGAQPADPMIAVTF
jgi:hypothetical protein